MEGFKEDIKFLQDLAETTTFEEFLAWVRKECTHIEVGGGLVDFDYGSVTGTINAKYGYLCGTFDYWTREGGWGDTIHLHNVYFKKQ